MSDILNAPTFLFSYYLFVLIAIFAAFGIAHSDWRRSLSPLARHYTVSFGLFGGVRLVFLLLLVLRFEADAVNHAVVAISMGILAWNFSPVLNHNRSAGMAVLAGNSVLALALFIANSVAGAAVLFNVIWLLWEIGLGIFILVSLFLNLNQTQEMVVVSVVLLVFGGLLQLVLAADQMQFVQLTEMIAYSVLVVAVYQISIESLSLSNQAFQGLTRESMEQVQGFISLFEASKNITSSLELSQVLDAAAKGLVDVVNVDLCTIALPEEGEASQLRITATYNPRREGRGEAVTFPVSDQPAIKHALERLREVEINNGYDAHQFKFLFALMGTKENVGPLLIQPLVLRNTAIGVLIVSNAYSKAPFGPTQLQLIKAMANQITIAIDNARSYRLLETKSQQLAWTLRNQEQESGRRQAAMEVELKKSREEVNIISQRLLEHDTEADNRQTLLANSQRQIDQLSDQLEATKSRLTHLAEENKQISQLREHLAEAERAKQDLDTLKGRVGDLEATAAEAEQLRTDLAEARHHGRKLVRALQLSRAKIQQMAAIPSSITNLQGAGDLENLACGILISDADGIISRVNTATTRLLARDAQELVGQNLVEVSDDEKWRRALKQITLSGQKLLSANFKVDDRVIMASFSPMVDNNGQGISGNVVILYDATEEATGQQARDEFIASLSQDLRTPMTSITGYIDLLLGESVGMIADMQRKFLQRVKANIERMDLMLRDLIGITAIDAGQLDIKPIPVDMAEVIEDAIIGAKAQLEEKDIQLHLELPQDMPPIVADPEGIQQVMGNLLANALKATPVGRDIILHAVVTEGNAHTTANFEEQRWLQISVSDSGGGIAEEDIERVFNRFYSAEEPLIQGLGETGVGLSIVKHLIEAHDGKVWLETEIGKGTTFSFTLPIKDYFNDPWQDLDVPPLDLNPDVG